MADDDKLPQVAWRSRDEMENLWAALIDALHWAKYGERIDGMDGEIPDERMEELKPMLQELMITWGIDPENADMDRKQEQAEQGTLVTNGYGAATQRPFVELHVVGQFRPEVARGVALNILDVAAVSEDDAIMLRFTRDKLELDPTRAAMMMQELRDYRTASRAADLEAAEEYMPEVARLRRGTVRPIQRRGG